MAEIYARRFLRFDILERMSYNAFIDDTYLRPPQRTAVFPAILSHYHDSTRPARTNRILF
jgi:hypothetical protein